MTSSKCWSNEAVDFLRVFWCPFYSFVAEFESREHEDAITPEIPGDLQPAKVVLHPKDIVNSKKNIAVRKEQKRKLTKQRSMGSTMDYAPMAIDKHEPEFVSTVVQNQNFTGLVIFRIFADPCTVFLWRGHAGENLMESFKGWKTRLV